VKALVAAVETSGTSVPDLMPARNSRRGDDSARRTALQHDAIFTVLRKPAPSADAADNLDALQRLRLAIRRPLKTIVVSMFKSLLARGQQSCPQVS
jgi:hypothetical protein